MLHHLVGQDVNSALYVAQAFESSSFNVSQNKQQYDLATKNKIQEIQMQGQQRGMAPGMGQPMSGNPNMMIANQQMATNNNQVFNPNMLNPNMQSAMMHNNPMASQPQPGQQHPAGMHPNNMVQNAMQAAQNRANGVPIPMQLQGTLTPQEQQLIQQRAENMVAGMNPAAKEAAKSKLPPHEVLALQSRGEDPVLLFYRRLATQQYLNAKQNSMNQQSGAPGAQFGGPSSMANGQMQGLLNTANGTSMAGRPNPLSQGFNGDNFEQLIDQQARAMRKQQEGYTVVPQSDNEPGISPQQTNLNAMQQQQQQHQQSQNQQQQQQHMRQTQQMLNNQRLMQNRPAQPGMQGQNLPNQGPKMGQSTSQQGPTGGNLSRPLGQPPRPESSNSQQVQARALQQGMPGRTGPQPSPNQSLPQAQAAQAQLQAQLQLQQQKLQQQPLANALNNGLQNIAIPDRLRAHLAPLPPAEQHKLINHWRNLQQQQQQTRNMQPAVSAAGTSQPMGTAPTQPQPPTSLPPAQSVPVGQPPMHEIGLRPGMASMQRMTPEQRVVADQRPFIPQISQVQGLKHLTIPEQVKSWGQLKNWLSTQPVAQETIAAVIGLQEKQFLYVRMQQQQQQQQQQQLLNAQRLTGQQQARTTEQNQAPQQHPEPAPPKQALPLQQPRPQQPQPQPQKQPEVAATLTKVPDKPAATAPEARMGPSRPANAQEQFLRIFMSLPDELTPELCMKLRAKIMVFREKGDEEIKEFVSMQKRKGRQYQQQQQRNLQGLSNGQLQPPSSNQMAQQPPMQPQVSMNQPPVPVSNQPANNQTSMPVKKEQNAPDLFLPQRSVPEQASKASIASNTSQRTRRAIQANEAKKRRFQELVNEAQSGYRTGPIQNMNSESKEKMRKLLVNIQPILPVKLLHALFIYFANVEPANEGAMRQFFISRMALIDQFEDDKCTTPKGAFTISLESAEKALQTFKMLYEWNKAHEMRNKAASMNAQPGQKPQPGPSELQSLQSNKSIDVKDMAHKVKMERAPDAPTSENPPNSFHNASPPRGAPNGVPTYAPTSLNGLTSDHLVLPESRKRKLNNANNQQQIKTQSPIQAPKPVSPPTIRPEVSFRCTHLGCEYQRKPFPTGELLARHIEDAHKEKEPEDGLQFALDMAKQALGLDINGNSIKVPAMEKSASAQTMKKSISSQSQALKVEGGVSMSRGTTQTSNLGLPRTPQSMSKSWDKVVPGKADVTKYPPTPDSWADCPVTPVELARLFPLLEAVQGTLDTASLTPASTLASAKSERNTPKSDVADNVAVVSEDMGNQIPPSFSNDILGFGQPFSLMDDDILGMSWDEAFPSPKRRKPDVNGAFDSSLFSLHLSNEVDFF